MRVYILFLVSLVFLAGCIGQNTQTYSNFQYENTTGEINFNTLEEAFNSSLNLKCSGLRKGTDLNWDIYISNGKIKTVAPEADFMFARDYIEKVKGLPLPQPPKFTSMNQDFVFLRAVSYNVVTEQESMSFVETKEPDYPNFNSTILKGTYIDKDLRKLFLTNKYVGSELIDLKCTIETTLDSFFVTPVWQGN